MTDDETITKLLQEQQALVRELREITHQPLLPTEEERRQWEAEEEAKQHPRAL